MTQSTLKSIVPGEEADPLIVEQTEHSLTARDLDRDALKVLNRLHEAGYIAYLVGGGVRDLYLGKTPKDFDISTDARPGQIRQLFRNSRTIGRRFRLVQVFFPGNKIMEVSTFRCRSEYDIEGGIDVLPANNTYGSEADDAFRRDLTINSLFYDIKNETIIDYTGGVADLDRRIIRFVGDPDRRIIRDPARMLRAVRHAARSGFTIEEATWQAIIRHKEKLLLCPVSRIRDELLKDLRGGSSSSWLQHMVDCGLFYVLFPFYEEVITEKGSDNLPFLLRIFSVIDRLHASDQQLPEGLLLGLFLIPWAKKYFPEMSDKLKNGEIYSLSRKIRDELEKRLDHLNIKRALKEQIAALLARLNLFATSGEAGKWPAYLKRKSYFKENLQFFLLYQEACGGETAADLHIPTPQKKERFSKRAPRRKERGPAFARQSAKGGVFGLRKR
ncbi:MAG: CCA tRNA nucleotidyltransferase [Pseudomonadota bacterium]